MFGILTELYFSCSDGGIGETLCKEFHSKGTCSIIACASCSRETTTGLRVFATARDTSSMKALQALNIETFELDVTKSDGIATVKARVEELTGGRLDILINNA